MTTEINTCGDCVFFTGEECDGILHEGEERYDDSIACEEFEEWIDEEWVA